jgi:hypothetical protein
MTRRYGFGFSTYGLDYQGFFKSDCLSIESLPSSGSLLGGRSLTISCPGFFFGPGFSIPVHPQTITVSFASSPLP